MDSPITLEQVYLLLGEKDVLIFQLGLQFNKVATEKAQLEGQVSVLTKQIEELHGELAGTNQHIPVLSSAGYDQGLGDGRGDLLRSVPDQSANRIDPLEPDHKYLRGVERN